MLIRCPHCKSRAHVRTSAEITPLLREALCQCSDPVCGHTFVAHIEAIRTLSPSAKPDPAIYLPLSNQVRRAIAMHPTMRVHEGSAAVRVLPGQAGG